MSMDAFIFAIFFFIQVNSLIFSNTSLLCAYFYVIFQVANQHRDINGHSENKKKRTFRLVSLKVHYYV